MWFGKKKRKYVRKQASGPLKSYTVEEKLRIIKEYQASGAPITVFSGWYGLCDATLKEWLERYKANGEAGLISRHPRGKQELPEAVKEEIVRLKEENPRMGVRKIADYLARNKFVNVYAAKVMDVLKNNPKTAVLIEQGPRAKGNSGKEPMSFERSKPREMFQMDIMTFMLKGVSRVYLIGCLDDYSRYVVSFGLFRKQTSEHCIDVLKSAIEQFGTPVEVLTDNGRQFYTWRGKSAFQKYVIKSGIQHIRSRPYHPQTLGKIESLWRNMYQELFSNVVLGSFEEAEEKIREWMEYYNSKRPHQGIGGLVPADRFFGVEKSMREVMEKGAGMVKDSLVLDPRRLKAPVYFVGNIGGKEIKIIAKEGSVEVKGIEEVTKMELKEEEKVVELKAGAGLADPPTGGAVKEETGRYEDPTPANCVQQNASQGVETGSGGGKNGGDGENGGGTDSGSGAAESGERSESGGNGSVEASGNPVGSEAFENAFNPDERRADAGSEPGSGSEPGELKEMEEQGAVGNEAGVGGEACRAEAGGLGGGGKAEGGAGESALSAEGSGEGKPEACA